MNEPVFPRIACRRSKEIIDQFEVELEEEAADLVDDDISPEALLRALIEQERWADAVRFLAHALPKREAVGWGCLCVRASLGETPPPEAVRALEAAETWVRRPEDGTRRAAEPAAEPAKEHPAGLLAWAAFFSGGSIAPAEQEQEVAPAPGLTGRMAANAVLASAYLAQPKAADERLRAFIVKGMEVAKSPPQDPA